MSRQPPAPGEIDRMRFVGDADVLAVTIEELADPDVRSFVIRHEHPEFEDALKKRLDEIDVGDGPISARLHLAMHEIVATQLCDDSPPEVWETAMRLVDAGYERHEILHMLSRPIADQVGARCTTSSRMTESVMSPRFERFPAHGNTSA